MEVILRPDLGKRAYRMRCRFMIDAYPRQSWLEQAKYAAAKEFIKDMDTQGWEYLDKFGIRMSGPYPQINFPTLPKRSQQEQWNGPARNGPASHRNGRQTLSGSPGAVVVMPRLNEVERWEYELAAVFVRPTLVAEVPDKGVNDG